MVDVPLAAAGLLLGFAAVVLLHRLGHYYAGRRMAGVPADDIALVLAAFPPHVALRDPDDGTWVPPSEYARYWAVYDQYDPEGEHAERFMAAGDIVQAGIVVPVAVALALAGFDIVASALVVLSLAVAVLEVLSDAVLTFSAGRPRGDYSGLWQVSPRAPVTLLVGVVLTHLGTFALVG